MTDDGPVCARRREFGTSRGAVQDIVVSPLFQRRRIGTLIVKQFLEYFHARAPDRALVGRFAAQGTLPLYARYGFRDHSPTMTGVFRVAPVEFLSTPE